MTTSYDYPYLHGFSSSAGSHKGTTLRKILAHDEIPLELLDLNVPDFGRLTYTGALGVLDLFAAQSQRPLRIAGSSMGGYLAALWASKHAERVESVFLLCPAFDLVSRWPDLLDDGVLREWEERGSYPFEDARDELVELHWEFMVDARRHEPWPEITCPVRIVHGRSDDVVPIELSRQYAARPNVELVEVEDDHTLSKSISMIAREMRDFWSK